MYFLHQFKADLIDLKHNENPVLSVELQRIKASVDLGTKVAEVFPYVRNQARSYVGEIPEVSLNREHHFHDLYECRFWAISEDQFVQLNELLRASGNVTLKEQVLKLFH